MLNETDLEKLKKIAANSPAQQKINSIKNVEDLGKYVDVLRIERPDLVSGVDLEVFLETFVAVCKRARVSRKFRGDELLDNPEWRDLADLIYTALIYE